MNKSTEILKKYWGFDQFRPMQEDIVESAIYGHDTFAILPTGGGKSICFQVPGLARSGVTIVISPLIALMQDQVQNLLSKGINASLITGDMSYREIDIALDNARFGNTKFLYTSPERLKNDLFIERFKRMHVGLIVVDEAHCISEWGHDFRPSYRDIAELRNHHPETPVIAVTASATKRVQDDIVSQLKLKDPKIFLGSLERTNISYKVRAVSNKLHFIINFCNKNREFTGIVYCQTRKSVKDVAKQLRAQGLSAGFYHGGLNSDDRKYMLEEWLQNRLRIMVATNAFGMGIDKPDVRYVLHYEAPNNLEAYYQEAGRAGRDGMESQAIALWERQDIDTMQRQLLIKYPDLERIKQIYNSICSFLHIAIGSGNGESYSFDIQKFHANFKIPITDAYYSLKILQANEDLVFTEDFFLPTRLKFAIGSSALYKFQVTHDTCSGLISLLTRSYPGIFDRFVTINENEIIKRLGTNKERLTERLKFLEQYGVIDISFQSQLPTITFLHERLPEGYLRISNERYTQRKEVESAKINAMIHYLTGVQCRSQMISEYFDSEGKKCGKCDICISERNNAYTLKELQEFIPKLLPIDFEDLVVKLQSERTHIQQALHLLILAEKIKLEDGKFVKI